MTLEDRVSNLESNVGAIAGALEQVTQALRGISAKQDEHSRTLAEHSEALQAIIRIQNEHSEALQAAIDRMNEHTRILLEHSVDIQFIKDLLDASTDDGSSP